MPPLKVEVERFISTHVTRKIEAPNVRIDRRAQTADSDNFWIRGNPRAVAFDELLGGV
jgi:hypothetical protein